MSTELLKKIKSKSNDHQVKIYISRFQFIFFSQIPKPLNFISQEILGNDPDYVLIETSRFKDSLTDISNENEEYGKYNIWEGNTPPFKLKVSEEDGSTMVIHMPAEKNVKNNKAVLLVPGGGYGVAMVGLPIKFGKRLQEEGYEVFILDYRVAKNGYHYPIQFQEVTRAMKWVKSKGKTWGFQANKTGVVGFSAGGHLASFLATRFDLEPYEELDEIDQISSRPAYHGLVYPVISFDKDIAHNGSVVNLTGKNNPSDEERSYFSNDLHVKENTPEAFIVHSWEDSAVVAENSMRYFQALRKNGVRSTLHLFEHGPHGVGMGKPGMDFSFWPEMMIFWMNSR
ncbi:MAG: alpha/beta hydrolase [Mongoliibacter sp.]|uniref:alpha/beta hydrolase n=1 Tax=Mongoliibacter sp. TaxID=2022438 RepID=UPI0012F3618C|nr:alpha/beta hydrolase [Mongoliibacter sp.]TVP52352.1 MAG: alpha/beta hydrolase [Mongoliibacter sp.]